MRRFLLAFVLANLATTTCAQTVLPDNTLHCAALTKRADGSWWIGAKTRFTVGKQTMVLSNTAITPRAFTSAGIDLYDLIEAKCAGQRL